MSRNSYSLNNIKPRTNAILNIVFTILSMTCVVPLLFIVMISISSEESLNLFGYRFWPEEFSISAYLYIFKERGQILTSYGVTLMVAVLGTITGIILNATFAYVLSRKEYRLRKFLTFIVLVPMLFNGGMVSFYLVVTQFLGLKNTIWALILPMAVSSFYIIILRTFFTTTIPDAIVESGKIDGASQLKIFIQLVLPISLPGLATIGLFLCFNYWNDWYNALLFIDEKQLIPIQALLMKIEGNLTLIQQQQGTAGTSISDIMMKLPKESVRMAIVVIVSLPIACAYPFFQRYFISGLTVGSVKG